MTRARPVVVRSSDRPRGKWHLPVIARTVCDLVMRGWDSAPRGTIDPRDVCARCLRMEP